VRLLVVSGVNFVEFYGCDLYIHLTSSLVTPPTPIVVLHLGLSGSPKVLSAAFTSTNAHAHHFDGDSIQFSENSIFFGVGTTPPFDATPLVDDDRS
jgi:hypothetical protein